MLINLYVLDMFDFAYAYCSVTEWDGDVVSLV